MPFVGETLDISLQLFDGDPFQTVRAILRDEAGAQIPGSPVAVPHKGNGIYTTDAILMPAGVQYISCTYEVADPIAGFPTLSPDYTTGTDTFRFEIPDQVIVDKLDEILAKLDTFKNTSFSFIKGIFVKRQEIDATISLAQDLKAMIKRDGVVAKLKTDRVEGEVQKRESLTGVIKCQ